MADTTLTLSVGELATCSLLVGLAIAVMQGDEARAKEFGQALSTADTEPFARSVLTKLDAAMEVK